MGWTEGSLLSIPATSFLLSALERPDGSGREMGWRVDSVCPALGPVLRPVFLSKRPLRSNIETLVVEEQSGIVSPILATAALPFNNPVDFVRRCLSALD